MFRRHPFRPARPLRRVIRRAALAIPGPLMRELQRANALEAQGKSAEAAPIFARLSDLAAQRALPARAARINEARPLMGTVVEISAEGGEEPPQLRQVAIEPFLEL